MTNLNAANSNQLKNETVKPRSKRQRILSKLNSYGKKLALSDVTLYK